MAIALALLFREVVISLLAGIWLGALYTTGWNPLAALGRSLDRYVVGALTDTGHVMILVFTLLLGGMIGIISRNGGTYGLVDAITRRVKGPISGQLAAYVMGLVIFFDDYGNTLIVGPTMRPITDRLGISREKLSYIVDSTAAPVASIALVSSWIGFEVLSTVRTDDPLPFLSHPRPRLRPMGDPDRSRLRANAEGRAAGAK
jgi:Na+/H+ antiporter NhaC